MSRVHVLMSVSMASLLSLILILSAMGAISTAANTSAPDHRTSVAPQHIEFVSQAGGHAFAIAQRGNYAYMGVGPRLVVVDVSNPFRPSAVGRTTTLKTAKIHDVTVSGDYAYAASGVSGLYVYDVRDPTRPVEVSVFATPGQVTGVDVQGNLAYLAEGSAGLRVLDVTDPAFPSEIGAFQMAGWSARRVAVSGSYAAVAASWDDGVPYWPEGVLVLDIANPAAPQAIGEDRWHQSVPDVAIADSYVYYTHSERFGFFPGLGIIGPIPSVSVHSFDLDYRATGPLAAANGHLFMFGGCGNLCVVNVANPELPRIVASSGQWGSAIILSATHAYLAQGNGGLDVVNIANPAIPITVGHMEGHHFLTGHVVAAYGDYVYAADWRRLCVINVVNPSFPVDLGCIQLAGNVSEIIVAQDRAYVSASGVGLKILDVSNPASLIELGTFGYGSAPNPEGVSLAGEYAFVSDPQFGFVVVHVLTPTAPALVATYLLPQGSEDIVVAGDHAHVAGYLAAGLQIVDVSTPAFPSQTGYYTATGFAATRVALDGNLAFVTNGAESDLHILNVGDPTLPVLESVYSLPGWSSTAVAYANRHVYVIAGDIWNRDLRIVNVTDPAAPTNGGMYDTFDLAQDVSTSGNFVYIADNEGGLIILWVTTPVSAVIPVTGGTLTSPSDQTTYFFPAGTFSQTTTVTHTARYPGNLPAAGTLVNIGHAFQVTAVLGGGQLIQPALGETYSITVRYTDGERGPAIEESLALYWWDGGQWIRELSSVVDADANNVSATPGHLGLWSVLGETHRVFLPLVHKTD